MDDNNFSNLQIIKKLGEGSSSNVYLVKHKETSKFLTLRITLKNNSRDIISSLENHKKLGKNKYILELLDWVDLGDKIYQIIEYGYGLDIFDYMKEFGFRTLPENVVKSMIKKIAKGLVYIHKNNVVHGDIKIENILIDPGTKGIKIIDFDLSFNLIKCPNRTKISGTLDFLAPEIISRIPYSYPVDIWALGIVGYEILEGFSPFRRNSDRDTIIAILNDLSFMDDTSIMSDECKIFIGMLLNRNASDRPSASDILKLPWLKEDDKMEIL